MKRRKVWWYSCQFCKKGTRSASATSVHEKKCTNNAERECGMCKLITCRQQPSMFAMIASIENCRICQVAVGQYREDDLDALRETARHCPACMLAALRLAGKLEISSFDFGTEKEAFFEAMIEKNVNE